MATTTVAQEVHQLLMTPATEAVKSIDYDQSPLLMMCVFVKLVMIERSTKSTCSQYPPSDRHNQLVAINKLIDG